MTYKVLDLFSGIGGFSLGLERTKGFETVAFCEIEKFPQKVLAKHWPGVPIYEDVRELAAERLRADGIIPNVITGGFPCQDISVAGNQKGISEGTRSGLWSECARLVGEIRPDYAIFENVTALLSGESGKWFERVLWDLSEVGYDAEWHCIPASELGAHHHRDRVWIIAYPNSTDSGNQRKEKMSGNGQVDKREAVTNDNGKPEYVADTIGKRQQGQGKYEQSIFAEALENRQTANALSGGSPDIWKVEPELGRVANGIPDRTHRLKGLGNAVVPQIPELIGRAILDHELLSN
jgi:DNA (cytosine-5)-methyltransferase 1